MTDYISREAAIEAIEETDWYHQNKNKDMVHGANSSEHQAWYREQDVYAAIKSIPAADVRPVVRGRWEKKITGKPESGGTLGYFVCSVCSCRVWATALDGKLNFCPNCGADMRGEQT